MMWDILTWVDFLRFYIIPRSESLTASGKDKVRAMKSSTMFIDEPTYEEVYPRYYTDFSNN